MKICTVIFTYIKLIDDIFFKLLKLINFCTIWNNEYFLQLTLQGYSNVFSVLIKIYNQKQDYLNILRTNIFYWK